MVALRVSMGIQITLSFLVLTGLSRILALSQDTLEHTPYRHRLIAMP